jgi:muramoyltetrapeptide carboxypeptidase LdcA involved in peptidoglycan recycling
MLGSVRYPTPLRPGDTIGVTAASSGVEDALRPRLDHCVDHLRRLGFRVRVGDCMDGTGLVSAPAADRAAELTGMLLDPQVRAVVPPWGGELAIDLLPLLDAERLAVAEPTWVVGYSDISTVLTPLTLLTGVATLHGPNLMDTPFALPEGLAHWVDVATAPPGATVSQTAATHRQETWPDFRADPEVAAMRLTVPTRWQVLGDRGDVRAVGRLVGGCLDTVSMLPGTPYGDVEAFAARHAPEGLLVYLEVSDAPAGQVSRMLHHLRYAGWFDRATGVMVGRTPAPASEGFTQVDALQHALGDLPVPVVYDVDIGHLPPQMALVNGALATMELTGSGRGTLVQRLV